MRASLRYDGSLIPKYDTYCDIRRHCLKFHRNLVKASKYLYLCVLQVKSVLTTLSGDEVVQLRGELDLIKDSFSLVEFDDEEVDEKKGNVSVKRL